MKKVSFILPVYNEEESVLQLIKEVNCNVSKIDGYSFEIIFIDDGSTDKSLNEMRKANVEFSELLKIKIISFTQNFGKTEALNAGINECKGGYIFLMDADLQDDPEYISKFLAEIEKNNVDLIVGNRINRYQSNFIKCVSSRIANRIMGLFVNNKVHDMNCGYKIMKISLAESLNLKSDYHRFIPMIAVANGFRVGEIDIKQRKRKFGVSKYGTTGLFRFAKSFFDAVSVLFIYKFKKNPFSFFGKYGFVLFAIGVGVLVYLSTGWFMGNYIMGRPLFFFGILCVLTGINMISIGLLGEIVSSNDRTVKYKIKK